MQEMLKLAGRPYRNALKAIYNSMRFREWLINEDPDELRTKKDAGGMSVTFRSGVTFTLLDGYYLSSKGDGWVMHEVIARHVWECRDAIEAALEGRGPMEDVNRCLGFSLKTTGRLGDKALRQLQDTAGLMGFKDKYEEGKKKFVAYRTLSLNEQPGIILGRIWPQHKTISFWNTARDLKERKGDVYAFMRSLGAKPEEFDFEVQNGTLTYDEFDNGRASSSIGFDPSKVHTMLPGEAKGQAMRSMGFMLSKPVDIRDRAAREGD